jgi:ELWxxDGT repeat protein
VLFSGYDANGNNGLWVNDGTAAGTHELAPISGAYAGIAGIFPQSITAFNEEALFQAEDASGVHADRRGERRMWVTPPRKRSQRISSSRRRAMSPRRSFYLLARRVREGVKDRIHNGGEGRALTLIPDHRAGRIARSSGLL